MKIKVKVNGTGKIKEFLSDEGYYLDMDTRPTGELRIYSGSENAIEHAHSSACIYIFPAGTWFGAEVEK